MAAVNGTPSGWPLGLENLNQRLRVMATSRAAEPNSFHLGSASFSSFSSSDLDTESTRSFFQDRSITLGRLIGIKPGYGDLYFPNSIHPEECATVTHDAATKTHEMSVSRRICIPLMVSIFVKNSPSRNSSKG